jgi:hypothetical protein
MHFESRNPDRINLRRAEGEVLVKDLQSKGFTNIYISGHSEGGRIAQSWSIPVKGLIVHGMDCKSGFWKQDTNKLKIILLNTREDSWLTVNGMFPVIGCKDELNKDWVTEVITDGSSHNILPTSVHVSSLTNWLRN